MDPTDEAELARLKAAHDRAVEWEEETRQAIYLFVQEKLKNGQRGMRARLIELTGWSPTQMDNIKAGRWSRNPSKNPVDNAQRGV